MDKKLLFLTSVPSFYKNLLFKELNDLAAITVFYSFISPIKRDKDFFKHFTGDYVLCQQLESKWQKFFKLLKASRKADYVYYGGWDDPYYWLIILLTGRRKNIVMLESSIYELRKGGLKKSILNAIKRFFLKRAVCVMASGTPQGQLAQVLGFNGKLKYTMGVGLLDFNYPPQHKQLQLNQEVINFLFIGRISQIKGIELLLPVFKQRPWLQLHLVGEMEDNIVLDGYTNVVFHGYKKRTSLQEMFLSCDVFILPSLSEPWGLVVEEALYHGLPVIVSSNVGCNKDIVAHYDAGIVFDLNNPEGLSAAIDDMCKPVNYSSFASHASLIDFKARHQHYIYTILSNVE